MAVAFRICSLFDETLAKHGTVVLHILDEFIKHKSANPIAPFGSKDYPYTGGVLSKHNPRLMHAGMTYNISLVYTIQGSNPNIISLYGFYTHDESGTGQPQNVKKQNSLSKRIQNQQTWRNL